MSLGSRVAAVAVGSALLALVAERAGGSSSVVALVVIVGAVAVGELLELRPPHRTPIPMSYAYMLVLVRAFRPGVALAAIATGVLVGAALRTGAVRERAVVGGIHAAAGAAGVVAYQLVHPLAWLEATPWMLTTLAVSGGAMIAVHEAAWYARRHRRPHPGGPDLALIASGILMAIGFRAVGGHSSVGLWGVVLFSVPLLAAWYSFARLEIISRTSEQTIVALSVVPEMGGLARPGHAARVADLAVRLGEDLGLRRAELDHLRAAALLHHLGHLCLDSPEVSGGPPAPHEVSDKGAEILRQTDLARAGDLLATDQVTLGGQILRLASGYDDLRADHTVDEALDALASGPGYLYDRRVLDALERAVAGSPVG